MRFNPNVPGLKLVADVAGRQTRSEAPAQDHRCIEHTKQLGLFEVLKVLYAVETDDGRLPKS
jgi:hypothetical protein